MKTTTLLITSGLLLLSSMAQADTDKVRPGAVLYKLKADATPAQLKSLNALFKSQGLIKEHQIEKLGITLAKFNDKAVGKELVISKLLQATGAVEFAEPDAAIEPTTTPNDSAFSSQWHHQKIQSPLAWDKITGADTSSSVQVCVLDTGVDTDHPDLIDNLILPGYNARLQVDGNVEDAHGHGTGTAGVIGAVGNNGIGVSGVAWDIDIIPVQINISNDNSSAYISDMATGIEWCAAQGVKVANLSYGGAQYSTISTAAQYLRDRGGLLFMSAGNDGTYHDATAFPDYSSFVVVGATNTNDEKSSFSEYGPYIDLAAPGESILTTYLNAQYVYYSGTSFSSPMTAGVGALVYAVNPNFTPEQVETVLFESAVDLGTAGEDDYFGHGRINAGAAVQKALELLDTPNQPPVVSATATPLTGTAPLEVSFDGSGSYDDSSIVTYAWDFGDRESVFGMNVTHTYTNVGTYYATLTVTDDQGEQATSDSLTIEVVEAPNQPPVANVTATPLTGTAPLEVNFDGSNSYDEGEIVSYVWSFGDGESALGVSATHIYANPGTYNATLTVTDDQGTQTTSDNVTVTVEAVGDIFEAPSNLAVSLDTSNVALSWTDNANSETGFVVERAIKVRGKYQYSEIVTLASNTTSYTDTVAEIGSYRYRVKAINETSSTAYSNEASVTVDTLGGGTDPQPSTLEAPVLSQSINGSTVTLTWSHNCPSGESCTYTVERGDSKTKGTINFTTYKSGITGLEESITESSGTYYYQVKATTSSSDSDYSNTTSARIR